MERYVLLFLSLNKTDMASSFSYRFVYAHVIYSVVNFGIPFPLLMAFSALLIAAYRAQCRRRKAMLSPKQHHQPKEGGDAGNGGGPNHDNEHSTTLVVVAIVATFGVCNFPAKMLSLVTYANSEWKADCSHPLYIISRIFNILELANSIGNFIVYCALRHQFRQAITIGASRRPAIKAPSPRGSHHPHLQHTAISEVHDDGLVTTTIYNKR
jgi:hypothetical protein